MFHKSRQIGHIIYNVVAHGAKILLKIYKGKPGDMVDTTATSIG